MDDGFTMFGRSERTLSPVNTLVLLVQSLVFSPFIHNTFYLFIKHSIRSYNIPFVHTVFEEDILMKFSIVRL